MISKHMFHAKISLAGLASFPFNIILCESISACTMKRHQNDSPNKIGNLKDIIILWNVYKCSLLINAEVNVLVEHQINITDDVFVQGR